MVIVMAFVVIACGGDDENTPEPTDTIAGGTAPSPAAPELPEGVSRLAEGASSTALLPSAVTGFDPIDFPLEEGAEPPPCVAFVFAFTWQVAEPDAGSGLIWRLTETGAPREIGSGPSGSATVGCGLIEAVNDGSERISLNVRYLIGRRSE
jgi:hypothetical protein